MSLRNDTDTIDRPGDEEIAELLLQVGSRRISRREVLRRGIALGLTVPAIGWLLAACGGDDDDTAPTATAGSGEVPTPTTAPGETPTAGTPQGGGRLTIIVTGNIPDLDPQSAYDSTASSVFFGTYEMLVRLKGSDTFEYEPMLASEWSSDPEYKEWTFTIPDGVLFHDGTTCDAEAVAQSFRRFHKMQLGPTDVIRRFVSDPDTQIVAVDKNTVKFTLDTGNDIFLAAMASQYGPLVVSPAAVEANKTPDDEFAHEWFRENVVGTGPYKLREYIQNDRIVIERFEDFHGGWDGPHFDEIVFRIVPESATRRQLIEAGEADALTQSLTVRDVTSIEQAGKLNVLRYDSTHVAWTVLNCGAKIKDPKARQGFSYAFPYEDVRQGVYEGLIIRTSGPCTPTTRGYDPNGFIYDTDLDKAKQLLEEAGWDFNEKLEYWLSSSSDNDISVAQLFQANLQKIGITMDIVQKEEGALTDFNYSETPPEERPHFVSWGWWPDYNDAYNEIYPNFASASWTPNGSNAGFYKNDRLDEILDTVAPGVPAEEYTTLMAEANNILTEQDPAAIYWGSVNWYTILQPNIKGFEHNPIYLNTYNVYRMYREG
ncbi:MAG: ABC transporter substrate-binding protein [Chloroflexi bacterium]|nr:MAG: ABC transporter substrate-binding protein [Chloroflexota bacterium]